MTLKHRSEEVKTSDLNGHHAGKDPSATADEVDLEVAGSKHGTHNYSMTYHQLNEPASLWWRDICYSVKLRKNAKKQILNNCAGHLVPGKMLAILGPSGSGKTSLLNVLAGRVPVGGDLSGEILLNGSARTDQFRLLSAYVIQDDALFHTLTVNETMLFAAELRLPSSIPIKKKQEVANKVIRELGLTKAANTYIGNSLVRGVSGGERKRVNLGTEMMGNPSLIFLDEPTSGLDSFQAQNVVQCLKELADNGRTVIMTIHQPRSSIFSMFDNIMLLSEGNPIYFGEASKALTYFASLGYNCPEHFNPADFYLDLIALDTRSEESEKKTLDRIQFLTETFRKAEISKDDQSHPLADRDGGDEAEMAKQKHTKKEEVEEQAANSNLSTSYRSNSYYQFFILLNRAYIQITRDKIPMIIGFVNSIVFALIVGSLFSEIQKTEKGIQDKAGALFFIAVHMAFANMFSTVNVFTQEKTIVMRERAARAYNIMPYYLSKIIAETFFRLVGPAMFAVIVYPMIGLNPDWMRFLKFLGIVLLLSMAAQTLGIFVGSAAKNQAVAGAIAPLVTVIMLLFGGFYINKDTIPLGAQWVEWISHIQWCFTALAINEFKGETGWKCDVNDNNSSNNSNSSYSSSTSTTATTTTTASVQGDLESSTCVITGEEILQRLSHDGLELWEPVVCQICLIFLFHVGAYFSLLLLQPKFHALQMKKTTAVSSKKD